MSSTRSDVRHLLVVDPGISTGIALLAYSEKEPARLEAVFQFGGGVQGFLDWYDEHYPDLPSATVIAEKFTPLQNTGHSLTMKSVEPLVIEGAMIAKKLLPPYQVGGNNPHWQRPAQMYFSGGKTLPEKKKRAYAWLKSKADHGFYVTGRDVGQKDADDARSAILHGVAWFRAQRHLPTLTALFREETA